MSMPCPMRTLSQPLKRCSAVPRSAGVVIFRLRRIARDDPHGSAERLDQCGIVGGLAPRRRGPGAAGRPRRPAGSAPPPGAARSRVAVTVCPSPSTTLMVSLTGSPGMAPPAPAATAGDHGIEQGLGGQGAGGVVHDDHLGLVGARPPARGGPTRPGSAPLRPPRRPRESSASGRAPRRDHQDDARRPTGRQAATAHSTTGRSANRANCFSWPKRWPEPPATTTAHTVRHGAAVRSGRRSDALRPSLRPR